MLFAGLTNKWRGLAAALIASLTILGFAIAFYTAFLEDKRPSLRCDVLTSTSVLDVKEELSNLSVLFDGMDIRKQGMSLRVIAIRILNDSSKDILKGYYDEKAPLGLSVSTGKIVKSELIDASNEYLNKHCLFSVHEDRFLLLPSLIIEAGEFFMLKLLVLHPRSEMPVLKSVGKIAGIQSVPVREAYKDRADSSFLKKTFGGAVLVQVTRLFAYTLALILISLAMTVLIAWPFAKLSVRAAHKVVQEFKEQTKLELNESDELIFDHYKEEGIGFLTLLHRVINDPHKGHRYIRFASDCHRHNLRHPVNTRQAALQECVAKGIIKETEKGVLVDEHFKETLELFYEFVKNRKKATKAGNI